MSDIHDYYLTQAKELETAQARVAELKAENEKLRRHIAEMATPQTPGSRANEWARAEAERDRLAKVLRTYLVDAGAWPTATWVTREQDTEARSALAGLEGEGTRDG